MSRSPLHGPHRAPIYDALILSDLHLRAGHGDDFVFDAQFEALVAQSHADGCQEIIFNGDTFEFVAMWPEAPSHPDPGLGFTELESLARLSAIARDHGRFFEALRRFVAGGGRCVFLPGNHDWDLHWPQVRAHLRALLGDPMGHQVRFVLHGEPYRPARGQLHIEHGHQLVGDQNLFLHPKAPIRPDPLGGPPRLEQPIGNHLVRTLVNPLERHFPFINNVRPFLKVRWLAPGHQGARMLRLLADAALRLTDDHRILRRLKAILLQSSPLRLFYPPALPNPQGRDEFVTSDLQSILGDDSTHQLRQAARRHLQARRGTRYVVLGHSHDLVTQESEPNRYFSRHGRGYLNPGCWNPCKEIPEEGDALEVSELLSGANYPYTLAFVRARLSARHHLEARCEVFEHGEVWLQTA